MCLQLLMVEAVRPRLDWVPLSKRGPRAWINAKLQPGQDRLLAHAVDTDTARPYLSEVEIFLDNMRLNNTDIEQDDAFDAALCRELSDMCFAHDQALYRGQRLFYGCLHLMPELSGKLPRSYRALKTW